MPNFLFVLYDNYLLVALAFLIFLVLAVLTHMRKSSVVKRRLKSKDNKEKAVQLMARQADLGIQYNKLVDGSVDSKGSEKALKMLLGELEKNGKDIQELHEDMKNG